MTLSDLTSKTHEELNVMCAETLGWKGIEVYEDNQGPPITHGYPPPTVGVDAHGNWEAQPPKRTKHLPNYTGSWDAIMPEVRKLRFSDKLRYRTHLQAVVSAKFPELGGRILTIDACTTEAEAIDMTRALILTLQPNQPAPTK